MCDKCDKLCDLGTILFALVIMVRIRTGSDLDFYRTTVVAKTYRCKKNVLSLLSIEAWNLKCFDMPLLKYQPASQDQFRYTYTYTGAATSERACQYTYIKIYYLWYSNYACTYSNQWKKGLVHTSYIHTCLLYTSPSPRD